MKYRVAKNIPNFQTFHSDGNDFAEYVIKYGGGFSRHYTVGL
jgi:hypothetical protein